VGKFSVERAIACCPGLGTFCKSRSDLLLTSASVVAEAIWGIEDGFADIELSVDAEVRAGVASVSGGAILLLLTVGIGLATADTATF
jgi:hypothetical protein